MTTSTHQPDLYDTNGAADYLTVSARFLQLDRSTKRRITHIKMGRFVRYRKADLDAYINRNLIGGEAA